ncbi:hypothetical protein [Streptomyces sp. NBC_01803]|uniref:hypothetical protein n=1 Tax=Streptomyces sp. NBC_01803 TaxID=2975946 RepID=UPI002DD9279F|nr:hypothetical protein [Streptomyces sp. NBC_01803]WSA44325.1 hypothetical protein OIE51_08965 [Streptomyces sp. NBC_01803]
MGHSLTGTAPDPLAAAHALAGGGAGHLRAAVPDTCAPHGAFASGLNTAAAVTAAAAPLAGAAVLAMVRAPGPPGRGGGAALRPVRRMGACRQHITGVSRTHHQPPAPRGDTANSSRNNRT